MLMKMMMMVKKEVGEEIESQRGSGTTASMFLHQYQQPGVRRLHGGICGMKLILGRQLSGKKRTLISGRG